MNCSTLSQNIILSQGELTDYKKLSRFHYRDARLGPFEKIFTARCDNTLAGVIVYSMPVTSLELRNIATDYYFANMDRRTSIAVLNRTVRTISRVIVDPRFRGLGLAARLVRETMPLMNVRMIESLAVMGHVNPFFEKAGMRAYTAPLNANCLRMTEALSLTGIEGDTLINSQAAQACINSLSDGQQMFLEREIKHFLQAYGRRANMPPGIERTKYILTKLTARPVYYIWINPLSSTLSQVKPVKCTR